MRFGTWNVRSMYRAGSLRTVAEEVSKYKLDLVGVKEVRWDGSGAEPAGDEECIRDIGGKPKRKETTGKTKT
jgi:hypothetical protein